jgi:hypothetical protein
MVKTINLQLIVMCMDLAKFIKSQIGFGVFYNVQVSIGTYIK